MNGKFKNVHVMFLKQDMSKLVKRVTTVLEDDVVGDEVTNTNGKVHVQKVQLTEIMQKDIDTW